MDAADPKPGTTAIVVVGKPARRGEVKTRLAEDVGARVATDLYRRFLADIASLVTRVREASSNGVTALLAWKADPHHSSYAPFDEAEFELVEQPEGGLGECMWGLSKELFERGTDRVLIIGTDSPTLHPRHLSAALEKLDHGADVVLGPSFDGGYYMIGLSGPHQAVFSHIDWSTGAVLGQTLRRAREAQLLCELTEFWYDVDTLGDLKKMRAHLFDYLSFRYPELAVETREYLETLPERVLDE
ncbi:MAG: TIGR04282 family arsenosugar biosynthesis glycosyltransferase [Myxococcota bacterium]